LQPNFTGILLACYWHPTGIPLASHWRLSHAIPSEAPRAAPTAVLMNTGGLMSLVVIGTGRPTGVLLSIVLYLGRCSPYPEPSNALEFNECCTQDHGADSTEHALICFYTPCATISKARSVLIVPYGPRSKRCT